jgi:hypothetical protein
MIPPPLRRAFVPAVVLVFALAAGAASADDAGANVDAGPVRIRQEWVGVEVPLGGYVTNVSTASAPSIRLPEQPHTSAGWGAILRFGRHHWGVWYWTPLALAGYEGKTGASMKYVAALTEPGLSVLSGGPHALDIGLGLGVGFMGLEIGGGCDGACQLGGGGPALAPVARYVYTTPAGTSAGVSLRGLIPTAGRGGTPWGYVSGATSLVLLSLDFAYGER